MCLSTARLGNGYCAGQSTSTGSGVQARGNVLMGKLTAYIASDRNRAWVIKHGAWKPPINAFVSALVSVYIQIRDAKCIFG